MMKTNQEQGINAAKNKEQNRRSFLKRLGQISLFVLLASLLAKLFLGKHVSFSGKDSCTGNSICARCKRNSFCVQPQAESFRRVSAKTGAL